MTSSKACEWIHIFHRGTRVLTRAHTITLITLMEATNWSGIKKNLNGVKKQLKETALEYREPLADMCLEHCMKLVEVFNVAIVTNDGIVLTAPIWLAG